MIIVTITTISSPALSSQRSYFLLFGELDYISSASSYLDRERLTACLPGCGWGLSPGNLSLA